MRKIGIALVALLTLFVIADFGVITAQAACPSPLTGKDAAGTTQNFATFNDVNNNCVGISQADQARQYTVTMQSAAVANGNGTALSTTGLAGATMTVNCASCSGGTTVNFEAQEDGSSFVPIQGTKLDGSAQATTVTTAGVTVWQFNLSGVQQIRGRVSAYSAGTITITAHAIAVPSAYPTVSVNTLGSITTPVSVNTLGSITTPPVLGAGTAKYGQAAIDQTTPGTTNGVQVNAALPAGTNLMGKVDILGNAGTALDAATGAAVPANALLMGTKASSGNMAGVIACDKYAIYDASTSGDTQIIAASGSTAIYVCSYTMGVGATATNVKLDYGTGSNCVTGTTALTPAGQFIANGGKVISSPFWNGLKTPASQALCVNASAANPVQVEVWYAQL
jgi:hypothetical protein